MDGCQEEAAIYVHSLLHNEKGPSLRVCEEESREKQWRKRKPNIDVCPPLKDRGFVWRRLICSSSNKVNAR